MNGVNIAQSELEIQDDIDSRLAAIGLERMIAGPSGSDGKLALKSVLSPGSVSGKKYTRLAGPVISEDDYVLVANFAGTKVVLGPLWPGANDDIFTFGQPVTAPKFNSPYVEAPAISNTAVVTSNTSTSVYEVCVENASFDLPTGVWDVHAFGTGMFSHSSEGGVVRIRLYIGSDVGVSISQACHLNPTRSLMSASNSASNLSGSTNISLKYLVNTSGTAFAGGGWVWGIAFRTA